MSFLQQALQQKRILVTGATGFIGGRLAERLATEEEAQVTGTGRHLDKAAFLREAGVNLQQADLQDSDQMQAVINGQEIVFHVAAWLGGGRVSEVEKQAYTLNVTATETLVRLAAAANVQRLVLVSSIAAYGLPSQEIVHESIPLDTTPEADVYGRTKAQGELRARQVAEEVGLDITIVRPGMVYGPRSQSWTVQMLQLVQKGTPVIFGDGGGHAWPVFIDNLVDGMLLAAVRPEAVGQAFQFSDPVITWHTFFGYYGQMCQRQPRRLPLWGASVLATLNAWFKLGLPINKRRLAFLTSQAVYPTTKAEELLGYRPRVSLDEGMRQTEVWLRQAGYLP